MAYQYMPARHIIGSKIQFKYLCKEREYVTPKEGDLLEVSAIEIVEGSLAWSLLKSGTYSGIKNIRIYGGSIGSSSRYNILFNAQTTHLAITTIGSLFKNVETLELINLYYEMELIVQNENFRNLQYLRLFSLYGTTVLSKPVVEIYVKKSIEELALYSSSPSVVNLRMDSGISIRRFHGNSTIKVMNGKTLSKTRKIHCYMRLKKGTIQTMKFY